MFSWGELPSAPLNIKVLLPAYVCAATLLCCYSILPNESFIPSEHRRPIRKAVAHEM